MNVKEINTVVVSVLQTSAYYLRRLDQYARLHCFGRVGEASASPK